MLVGSDREILGLIAVADRIRKSSRAAVEGLRRAGIEHVVMLTGDNAGTAGAIAAELGISQYRAELLPENKLSAILSLKHRYGKVAMVGDGVNDAPALAAATVGIAMGGAGTDTALETADIALMADDLSKLPYAMDLSRRALKIIKQNIAFALLVKAVFITGTFWGITNLWMAVFADTGAALLVIANGMRLMRVNGATPATGLQDAGRQGILYNQA
jgi:Cd2+/Zn2+-exporting ATPase